ncbi:MAG: permease [Rhodospirillaceae bacterium]|nr:permease [Rhodospirillaceae bacterium]
MQIYLPVAEMSVNVFLLLGLGGLIGLLSGMFGVGGGFLLTPLLMFVGVPPPIAVASAANQITAASVSGLLAHWRRGNVDVKMGIVLTIGGGIGSAMGVYLFSWLRDLGQIDLVISLSYVLFLGVIASLMMVESITVMVRRRRPSYRRKLHHHFWMHGLPLKMRFRRSKLYISVLPPLAISVFIGVLLAIMGVGGGFIMIPAMIYLLGMPTSVVVGTSLFQITVVTAIVTVMHAVSNHAVDMVLAMLLLIGAVVGAQFGSRLGSRLRGEQLRGLLAVLVLMVAVKVGWDLVSMPADIYSISVMGVL